MKHQQVNVDYWAMLKGMFTYGLLTVMGWMMLRLFNTAFMLPRRLRSHQQNIQNTLEELRRRFPDMNFTEEELKNAERELEEEYTKEKEEGSKTETTEKPAEDTSESTQIEDDKKKN